MSKESLIHLTGDLQSKVDTLTKVQSEMAAYLHTMSRNYHMVVEELMHSRRNMAAQDNLVQDLVQYVVAQDNGTLFFLCRPLCLFMCVIRTDIIISNNAMIKALDPKSAPPRPHTSHATPPSVFGQPFQQSPYYSAPPEHPEVARASLMQMCEISRQALAMSKQSHFDDQNPNDKPTDFTNELAMSLPYNNTGSSLTPNLPAPPPVATTQAGTNHEGLTVFTVGHFTPRAMQPSNSSPSSLPGFPATTKPASVPTSMVVHRSTLVPGWAVPPKVLLVEDDATYRQISGKLLRVFGCSFDVAVDGIAAVSQMNLIKYDIVLMVRIWTLCFGGEQRLFKNVD